MSFKYPRPLIEAPGVYTQQQSTAEHSRAYLSPSVANECIVLRLSRVGGATVYQADRVLHPVPLTAGVGF